MTTLQLTFPRDGLISLACANGIHLRYEVKRLAAAIWELTITADGEVTHSERAITFASERAAKTHARADFRRRQIVRLAA
jgi:hypothetical protein